MLNRIRDGDATEEDLEALNERTHPIRTLGEGDPYVILTPTNAAAQRINMAYLDALPSPARNYEAGITGEYSDGAHPTDASLILKEGAKVILLRNDPDRRWVNGSIARVARLEDKRVWIELDGKTHEIEQASWEARRYAFDQSAEKVVENVTGTFRQFPLRLAWALTIHKSQGLTLDKVYIDLGRGYLRARPGVCSAFPVPYPRRSGAGSPASSVGHHVRPIGHGLPRPIFSTRLALDQDGPPRRA